MLPPVNSSAAVVCKCETCGNQFQFAKKQRARRRIFCPSCMADRERAGDRERQKIVWRERNPGFKPVGAVISCVVCNAEFVKTSGPLKRCEECKAGRYKRWIAARRRSDPTFDMLDRIRRSINGSLGRKVKRGRPWEALVGYTADDLMRHLERQFMRGMSWDNRSKWHIDHIVPLSAFRFKTAEDEDFKACFALTNLRPLWAPANQKKSDIRTHLL